MLLNFLKKAVLCFSFHIHSKALSSLSWLAQFEDVLIFDASPVRLPKKLKDKFPGNRKNHSPACIKLSALYSLFKRTVEWIDLSPQKMHDSKILPDLSMLKGSLFLFDLGYFSHLFLNQLNEAGVWFVCRLKANSKPVITKVVNGFSKRCIGKALKKIKPFGNIAEAYCILNLPKNKTIELRVIGFKFPKTNEYRWYLTNLPISMAQAAWIYPIYRLRWQIELFFKSIKTILHADQITSANENIALVMCYSTILSALIANSIIIELATASAHIELKSITAMRLMIVYSSFAHELVKFLLRKNMTLENLKKEIMKLFPQLLDPNRKRRPTSLENFVLLSS